MPQGWRRAALGMGKVTVTQRGALEAASGQVGRPLGLQHGEQARASVSAPSETPAWQWREGTGGLAPSRGTSVSAGRGPVASCHCHLHSASGLVAPPEEAQPSHVPHPQVLLRSLTRPLLKGVACGLGVAGDGLPGGAEEEPGPVCWLLRAGRSLPCGDRRGPAPRARPRLVLAPAARQ